MKNKTIAVAGALIIGGLLTINSIAFADTADAKAAVGVQKRIQFEKLMPGKQGGFALRGEQGIMLRNKLDWSEQLKELVAAGTITQATADKMLTFLTEQENTRKAEMEKLQTMTAEQRKTYFESKKSEVNKKINLFSSMVEKGIITQGQSDAIKDKLQDLQQAKRLTDIKTSLDPLVQNKTITQEQVTKVTEYMSKQQAAKITDMEKIEAMTKEEIVAYFKSNVVKKVDIFSQLVTDKVLTQEQADAVEKVLHPMGHFKGEKPGVIRKFDRSILKSN
ncbi:MAG: hypothetical protein A2Y23_12700 [Clostridiales bacterium GWB2_37_7]|nr:MAG: hypothetical protein A2Y23_12700 [Clostridiales bacterium GWB2_37_7]